MQTAFFIVIGAIMATVLFLAFKAIGRGMDARGELKRDGTLEKNKQDPYTFKSCLLYTSPSPRDVEESRMPSSA